MKPNSVVEAYVKAKDEYQLLRFGLPEEKKPTTPEGKAEMKMRMEELQAIMRKNEKRLTYDQKKELNLLPLKEQVSER